jgi:hypothetical protein
MTLAVSATAFAPTPSDVRRNGADVPSGNSRAGFESM